MTLIRVPGLVRVAWIQSICAWMVLEMSQLPDGKGFGHDSYMGLIFVTLLICAVNSRLASA